MVQDNKREILKGYSESKKYFQKDLLEHFPLDTAKKILKVISFEGRYPDSICKSGKSMDLCVLYSHQEIIKIKQIIEVKAKEKIHFGDTCQLVICKFNNFYDKKSYDSLTNYLTIHCKLESSPIPTFIDDFKILKDWLGKKNVNEDLTVYILDSKQGEFLEKQYLTEGLGLSHSWKNGYSRGTALSEKNNYVIYWVNVW
jgi:hypothetical protein